MTRSLSLWAALPHHHSHCCCPHHCHPHCCHPHHCHPHCRCPHCHHPCHCHPHCPHCHVITALLIPSCCHCHCHRVVVILLVPPHCHRHCYLIVDEGLVAALAAHIALSSLLGSSFLCCCNPSQPSPSSLMKALWQHWLHTLLCHHCCWDCVTMSSWSFLSLPIIVAVIASLSMKAL